MSHATSNRVLHLIDPRDDYWYLPLHKCSKCDNEERSMKLPKDWGEDFRGRPVCNGCQFRVYVPPKRLTVRQRLMVWWFWFVDGGDAR